MHKLLDPQSIAVVGTSTQGGRGAGVHRNLLLGGYGGRLYGVNPKYEEVLGTPCYPSVADLPEAVDCAVIALAAEPAVGVFDACIERGVGSAVLFASGFSEAGGKGGALQRRLADLARGAGVAVCGPNCFGLMNLRAGTIAASGSVSPPFVVGHVALVSQSGGLSLEVGGALMERHVGFTHVVSTGNEAATTAEEYLDHLVEDPDVRVLSAIIEQIRRPRQFAAVAARAATLDKPFVVLTLGRSESGRRAVGSHTGSLAGDDDVLQAAFTHWGLIRVQSIDELVETLALFSTSRRPTAPGAAFVSASGGRSALLADLAADAGLRLAEFSAATGSRLRELLPAFATVGNPLDVTGGVLDRSDGYESVLRTLAGDPRVGLLAVYQGTRPSARNTRFAGILADVAAAGTAPVVAFTTIATTPADVDVDRRLAAGDVPLLRGTEHAVRAIRSAYRYAEFRARHAAALPDRAGGGVPASARRLVEMLARDGALAEHFGHRLLALYGVPVPRGGLATSPQEAEALAAELGFPVALKAASPRLLHKTDLGLVRLGVGDGGAVQAAYEHLRRAAAAQVGEPDGVLVQEMVDGCTEILVGARSSDFGPVVLCGAGGVQTEMERDVALRLAPVSADEARGMLAETRAGRRLERLEKRGGLRVDDVADAVAAVSRLAASLGEVLGEIDVNPLIVGPAGAVAVDCVMLAARGPR